MLTLLTGVSMKLPDHKGHFGIFGGIFVPETLMQALADLKKAYTACRKDKNFQHELRKLLRSFVGRPTPLYYAERLSSHYASKIFLKREDLAHTGAHKINNCVGQGLLARRMKKKRVIAETGAGQHGVATATAAAFFGMQCHVYMGEEDIKRQAPNVERMHLLGAEVIPVSSGSKTLKDAMNEAMRDWVTNVRSTYYMLGSVAGPHPYPMMVRDFQVVIGRETKKQLRAAGVSVNNIIACVGGGSNAIGIFYPFIRDRVNLYGIEGAGTGLNTGKHSAPLATGRPGVLHGSLSYLLQDNDGQVKEAHSIAAGLDYPGVGPEHSYFKENKIVKYDTVTDKEAVKAFKLLSEKEGILPALESAHALAYLEKMQLRKKEVTVINLSGRGDKDLHILVT